MFSSISINVNFTLTLYSFNYNFMNSDFVKFNTNVIKFKVKLNSLNFFVFLLGILYTKTIKHYKDVKIYLKQRLVEGKFCV